MRLGTRGSALALAQTRMVMDALEAAHPGQSFSHHVIQTTGDIRQDLRLGRPDSGSDKSVWTKELEAALAEGVIDAAVHSAKDVPTDLPSGFRLAGCLRRAATEDVLIARHPGGLDTLPSHARVATSSVRRTCQLLHQRPDLQVIEIRGNVPTRLQKLADTANLDALVLARAGLDRLGYATPWIGAGQGSTSLPHGLHASLLPAEDFPPAAAQGIVTIEVYGENAQRDRLLDAITDAPTWRALMAERAFLRFLQAGCHTPIGLHTRESDGQLSLNAAVFDEHAPPGTAPRITAATGPAEDPVAVAQAAFQNLSPC